MPHDKAVVHITPHLNGGLGKVLKLQLSCLNNNHYIYLLDNRARNPSDYHGFEDRILDSSDFSVEELVDRFEIIQVEYWNHPLIYHLILSGLLNNSKSLIGCSHIQGDRPPQLISENVINYFDHTLVTGTWLHTQTINQYAHSKASFIRFPIDTKKFSPINPNIGIPNTSKIRACYVGTVAFSKMSHEFGDIIQSCREFIDFTIVGEPHEEVIRNPKFKGKNVNFVGYSTDVVSYFQNSDIFVYPLRRGHYGTGELALVEAMSCGLPTVAFDNESERSLIDKNNGILCTNVDHFIDALKLLSSNENLRKNFGISARNKIIELYEFGNFDRTLGNFYESLNWNLDRAEYKIYKECLVQGIDDGGKAFIQSLQSINGVCKNSVDSIISSMSSTVSKSDKITAIRFFNTYPEYKYNSKGGLGQYLYFFPDSISLNILVKNLSLEID